METRISSVWRIVVAVLPVFLVTVVAHGQTTWNNNNSNSWNDPLNWSNGLPTPTALANFSNTGAGTITLDANQSALGLSFTNTSPYIFNSGAGTNTLSIFGSGIASNAAGSVTINPQITLGAAQTWALTNSGATLTTGDINLNSFGLTIGATNAGQINMNGVVSGTGALSVAGGVVALGSANSYAGTTTVTGGTLRTLVNGALPSATTLAMPATTANGTVTIDLMGTSQSISNLTFTNTAATTVNFTGTSGSSLTVSPATLTLAPSLATNNLTVSMASLSTFTYNNTTGTFNANNGASANPATNAVDITLAGGTNNITAATLNIGNGTTGGGVVNTTINLGTTNTLKVNTIRFGSGREGGNLKFASGLTNPTLTITGAAGGSSLTDLNLGQGHDSNTLSTTPNDTFDTTAGTLTAQFNNVVIAQNVPAAGNRIIVFNSNFLMGAGSITANTMSVGVITQRGIPTPASTLNSQTTGLFTLAGGTASIGTLTLATTNYTDTFTGTNTLSGKVVLNGGATLNATTIQRGANATPTAGTITVTSQIDWNDGTIGNISGGNLGISGITLVTTGAAANHTFNISGTQTATVSSVISGPGPITKAGTGTLVYSGVNTLTGATTVNAGTLRLSGSGTFGATTAALTVNGGVVDLNGLSRTIGNFNGTGGTIANNLASTASTLTLNGTGSFSGTIADNTGTGGTLGLTKTGSGAVTLNGTHTYTGATSVNAGTLTFTSTYPTGSPLTVAAGGTLSLNNGLATALTIPGLSLGSGTGVASLALDLGASNSNDSFSSSANATTLNNVRFDITPLSGFASGNTYTLLSAPGGLATANYSIGAFPSGYSYTLTPSDTAVQLAVFTITPTTGAIYFNATSNTSWASVAGGNSNTFTTDAAGTTPSVGTPNSTNTVNFTTGSATIVGPTVTSTLDTNYTINDLVFNNQTKGGTVTAIAINAGNAASNTLTITPSAATTGINVQTGAPTSVSINAPVTLGANQTWTVADAPTVLTINGAMSGSASLTKNGPGTLRFLDASFAGYSGPVAISAGAVNFEVTTGTQTVTSVVSGVGSVSKTGAGNVVLSGANTYSGGTTLAAGTLTTNNATAIGTGPLTINSGTTLGNSTGNLVTYANNNPMTWNGDFTKSGNSIDVGTGNVTLTAHTQVTVSANNLIVGGVVGGGAFNITKAGTGTLLLNGLNTYSGSTNVTAGVLTVNTLDVNGNASSIGTGTTLGINAATLRYTGTANAVTNRAVTLTGTAVIEMPTTGVDQTLELSGVIDGAGALTKAVTGTSTAANTASSNLILSNPNNTFAGNVTINAGTVTIKNSGGLGTGTKTITMTAGTSGAPSLRLDPGIGGSISLPSTFSFSTSSNGQNSSNPNGLGAIDSRTGNNTIAGTFTLMSGGGNTALNVSAGSTLTMSGGFSPNTTGRALELRGDGTGIVSGLIADGSTTNVLSVVRTGGGNGVWTLTNNNTYTSGTTVGGGTLLASNVVSGTNSATGTGAVTVNGANGGGILGGTGSIAGALTVTTTSGTPGTLRPGDANANGTLTVLAGVAVNSGARLGFHIGNAGSPAATNSGGSTTGTLPNPTSNNFLNITGGTTTISSGTVLALDGTGATFAPFQTYSYQVAQGAGNQNLSITSPSQFVFTNFNITPASATFTGTSAGNLYVNLTFVPEPATLGLMGLAATALLGRRPRFRRLRDTVRTLN